MSILKLHITNFRNMAEASLALHAKGIHLICGENGSGKTNLLESIYYLGLGKSFRTTQIESLMRHNTTLFSIIGQLMHATQEGRFPIGVQRYNNRTERHINGEKNATLAELAYLLPIRFIDTHSHALIETGPIQRRQYLDWGIFYTAHPFLQDWRTFCTALKQRNMGLRHACSAQTLQPWTDLFIQQGMILDQLRKEYVALLIPIINKIAAILLEPLTFEMSYEPGWDQSTSLALALSKQHSLEARYGYTLSGPHRADLIIKCSGQPVKQLLSRGQQKLLIYAMIIAQGMLLQQMNNPIIIYLIDDLPAELDRKQRMRVLTLLAQQCAQIFITAIEHQALDITCLMTHVPIKMFHVEQGRLMEKVI